MDSTASPTVTADDTSAQLGADHGVAESSAAPAPAPVADELLIEEISIDGMCGVY
jgi:mycofactocin precursor